RRVFAHPAGPYKLRSSLNLARSAYIRPNKSVKKNPIIERPMRIAIGADHAGFAVKQHLLATLTRLGHAVDDRGTHTEDAVDYPPICADVARLVVSGGADRGIVIGGSGQGEQMTANKVRGVRAALCNDLYTARMSREHNDANVLAMGGRIVAFGLADEIVALWLKTGFEGGRHQRRLDQILQMEQTGHAH